MARQFSLNHFIRRVPRHLLEDYLRRMGLDVNAGTDGGGDWVGSLTEALESDEERRDKILRDLHGVSDLADECGIQTLLCESRQWCPGADIAGELAEFDNAAAKSLWVFLHHPDLFHMTRILDGYGGGTSVKQGGFPKMVREPDDEVTNRLGRAISIYYLRRDGRGRGYSIDYRRIDSRHYWFAYLESYPDSVLAYDEDHHLRVQIHRPAFEIMLRYDASDQTLEVRGVTGGQAVRDVQTIFARTVFGMDSRPADGSITYDLSVLRNNYTDFPVDAEFGIKSVRLRRLKITALGRHGISLTLDINSRFPPAMIGELLGDMNSLRRMPPELLHIEMAGFEITFNREDGEQRGRKLVFWVSYPNASSLRYGGKHEIARRCLKKWGIDVSGSA